MPGLRWLVALVVSVAITIVVYLIEEDSRRAECIPTEPTSVAPIFLVVASLTFGVCVALRAPR